MNEDVKLIMKKFSLNSLHYVSLPGYSFDCSLMLSCVTLDTLQDKQMLNDFVEAKRGGICGIIGDRYINTNDNGNSNINGNGNGNVNGNDNQGTCCKDDNDIGKTIWYIDANNLYGYAMMQK